MNKSNNITNENYLEAKNHASFSPINFQENIITDPSVPPNGLIIKLNNEKNYDEINNNEINNNEINNNEINNNEINNNEINNNQINNNITEQELNNNDKLGNEVSPSESDENNLNVSSEPAESTTISYTTEMIDNVARAPHNKRNDSIKKEINRIKNMSVEDRAKLQVRNEIMQIFPLSIIIALIIFILLLIYIIGFKE